ncbi:hypothetical protein RRG08_030053 [Elysia crispata]|uniref:Uncharacterized protein n=1 Tax=Elysia crispata TaxID=231223 RepID=A0AAE1CPL4_9GAST|nr:hypothetical protein RRG08_030053 [Elysia crispata]
MERPPQLLQILHQDLKWGWAGLGPGLVEKGIFSGGSNIESTERRMMYTRTRQYLAGRRVFGILDSYSLLPQCNHRPGSIWLVEEYSSKSIPIESIDHPGCTGSEDPPSRLPLFVSVSTRGSLRSELVYQLQTIKL